MKKTKLFLTAAILLTFGIVPLAASQMMGGNHDHSKMNGCDTISMPGKMKNLDGMMSRMSENCENMISRFQGIEKHVETMMQMDDLIALKAELQKHLDMMRQIHDGMMKQRSTCKKMMSTMGSGGMHDMMKMGKSSTDSSQAHSHDN